MGWEMIVPDENFQHYLDLWKVVFQRERRRYSHITEHVDAKTLTCRELRNVVAIPDDDYPYLDRDEGITWRHEGSGKIIDNWVAETNRRNTYDCTDCDHFS